MTEKKEKSLVNLAMGGKKTTVTNKSDVENVKTISTPEEVRDLKAKETVEKLLQDIPLNSKDRNNEELLEIDSEQRGSLEWLQEQVTLLSSENQNIKNELDVAKNDYRKIFAENQQIKNGVGIVDDSALITAITTIFHELQSNYIKMGFNPITHDPNFVIVPGAFLNRLIMYFPFLEKEKRI